MRRAFGRAERFPEVLFIGPSDRRSAALARSLVRFGCGVLEHVLPAAASAAIQRLAPRFVAVAKDLLGDGDASLLDALAALAASDAPAIVLLGAGDAWACELLTRCPHASVVVVPTPLDRDVLGALFAHADRQRSARRTALHAQREHFELVIEGSRLGVWDWDGATGVYRHNARLSEILGLEPHECPTDSAAWAALVHPDDLAGYEAAMDRHVRGELPDFEHAYRLRHRDGRWIHVLARGRVVARGPAGEPTRVCGTTTDITSVKEAERLAREASEAKTRFLANMSHELRTPLNAVLGLSEALLEGTFGRMAPAQTRSLRTIHDSGRHLLALINDVLDLSRIEAGALALEPERISLRRLVDEVMSLVQPLAAAKQQRLLRVLGPGLPDVQLDHRRMRQVLLNLLGNAIKFSPSGARITLAAQALVDEAAVELEVRDTGPGIAEGDLERIFERFVTLEPTLSKLGSGAGLGLAVARSLVALHGGTLRVESSLGLGSRFVVHLPADAAPVAASRPGPLADDLLREAYARREALPRVLLAADDEASLATMQTYLEGLGHPITVARDGLATVTAAAAADLEVIVVDVRLSSGDGLEVVRRIRAGVGGPLKTIVVVTSDATPGDEDRCLAAGADAYMAHPVRLQTLAYTIMRHARAAVRRAA